MEHEGEWAVSGWMIHWLGWEAVERRVQGAGGWAVATGEEAQREEKGGAREGAMGARMSA